MNGNPKSQDFYQILGVSRTATADEIKSAYRALAKKLHPDLNPGNKQAEAQFKKVSLAYDTLSDPQKRAKYDRGETEEEAAHAGPFYYQTQSGPGRGGGGRQRYSRGFSFEDVFGEMSMNGEDAVYQMEVDFRDAVLGAQREITLPDGRRLAVKIPAGIDSGAKLRFSGYGGPPMGRGKPGDAYVEVRVRPSSMFKRVGKDIEIEVPISLGEAILGGEIQVPTIEGQGMLKIPPGVNTGSRLRIRGKGVAGSPGGTRGDEIVLLKVILPKTVDPEFRQAVEKWSKAHPYNPREDQTYAA